MDMFSVLRMLGGVLLGVLLGAGLASVVATGMVATEQLKCEERIREGGLAGTPVGVLAAKRQLEVGEAIMREDLTVLEYPPAFLPPRYTPRSLVDDLIGVRVQFRVAKGSPILTTDLMVPAQGDATKEDSSESH